MPSTYSPDLRIELIGPGEQAGTWNTTTNTNLGTLIEDTISGYVSVSVTSANQALSASNGAVDQARNATVALSTTTGANFAVYAPPTPKQYLIHNTSAFTATIYNSTVLGNTTAAGFGAAVPAGATVAIFSDGFNFRLTDTTGFFGVLPVVNGGTGVTTSTGTGATVRNTSPTLTGAPLAPTAAPGTNTTQVATTAFVQAALQALHPVGSVYTSTVATNPGTTFGFGTWAAFGAGRVLIGNGGAFSAGATGGSADATLPSHTHTATVTDPSHSHAPASGSTFITTPFSGDGSIDSSRVTGPSERNEFSGNTATAVTGITVANSTAGVSGTNANLQPYIVVYLWNRTAYPKGPYVPPNRTPRDWQQAD